MADGIKVHIYGDYNNKDIARAQRDLESLKVQSSATQSKLQGLATSTKAMLGPALLGASVAAGAFAVKLGVDAVKAAIDDQAAVARLAQTMKNLGLANQQAGVEKIIDDLQFQYGVTDGELRPAMDRLLRSTMDVGQANSMLSLALDISANKHVALSTVTAGLGKALDGNTGALGRMGLGIDKATLKSGDMDKILGILSDKFKGSAAAAAETFQGKIARVSTAVDELKEAAGYGVIDGFTRSLGTGSGNADDLVSSLRDAQGGVKRFGEQVGVAAGTMIQLVGWIGSGMTYLDRMSYSFGQTGKSVSLLTSPLNTLITAWDAWQNRDAVLETGKIVPANPNNTVFTTKAQQADAAAAAAAAARAKALAAAANVHTGTAAAAASHAKAVDYTAQAYAKLKTAYDDWYKDGFDGLKTKLDEATSAFSDFKTSVRDSIAGALDFGSAAQEVDESGAKVGKSFMEKLQEQAALAVGFADKVKQLITLNLSKDALSQVIAAGATAGSSIADELIAGGSTAIDTTNSLVTSAQGAADEVGTLSAEKWYGAGVKSAQATVDAFAAEYGPKGKSRAAIMEHMDKLAESMNRNATVTVTTINRVVSQSVPSVARGGIDNDVLTPFALGGVVTGPTRALIGEKGPEAVIPLDRMGQMGGTTINVYVEGSVSSERDLITSIRDGIAQDVRRRGGDPSFLGV